MDHKNSQSASYAAAGVDIVAGYRAVELMKKHVARTRNEGCLDDVGGFGGCFGLPIAGMEEPVLVSGTDGCGTKVKLAILMDKHDTIGIDAVAMCVNDIICVGAKPLFFLDYIACGKNVPEKIAQIGEKLSIRRFAIVEGTTSTYIHGMGTTGVIVKFEADEAAKNNAGFAEFAKNIALQIAAGSPPTYVAKEDVPASVLDEEKAIVLAQLQNDPKNANKPAQILEKMVIGKVGKYYEANCLLEQAYVKDDKLTVGKYVEATAKEFGGKIKVVSFTLFEKGEGLQKREENFAEEIAKLAGGNK